MILSTQQTVPSWIFLIKTKDLQLKKQYDEIKELANQTLWIINYLGEEMKILSSPKGFELFRPQIIFFRNIGLQLPENLENGPKGREAFLKAVKTFQETMENCLLYNMNILCDFLFERAQLLRIRITLLSFERWIRSGR